METVVLCCCKCDESFNLARRHRGDYNLNCNLDAYNAFFNKHKDCGEALDNFRLAFPAVMEAAKAPEPTEDHAATPRKSRKTKAADEE
jgi:hypothetical protein